MITLALAAATAALHIERLQTYKDWVVGCDNVRSCQANVLEPEGGGDYTEFTINRTGSPGDLAKLSIPIANSPPPGDRLALKVDGATIAIFSADKNGNANLALTRPMLRALNNGRRVVVVDASGRNLAEASLSGLSAALRFMDDRQKRVNTVGALTAVGPALDATVPTPPAAPLVVTPAPSAKPPRTISVALATRLIGRDSTDCDDGKKVEQTAYRLDADHTLVLIDHPCGNGAYNYFTSVYVLNDQGPPNPALFDYAPGMGKAGEGDLTNGGWDPKTRQLSSFEKARGLGDCGTTESYAWDGSRFILVEATEMSECRGSNDFIRIWTARTEPRRRTP